MKTCAKCGSSFPVCSQIDGKTHNLNSRKYCLSCSPFGRHNTRKLEETNSNLLFCTWHTCKKPLTGKQTKFCSKSCNLRSAVTERRRKLKTMAVEYLGGRCQVCGYNRCVAALEFHHVLGRDFGIAKSGHTKSWDKVKREIEKCVLLCSNCHKEAHWDQGTVAAGFEPA